MPRGINDVGRKNGNGANRGFEEKMARRTATLEQQFAEPTRLEAAIRANLRGLGYGE
ncbi:MAG TPA: hypothetical protein VF916_06030 [Ktedonobacterales bacterium]